MRLERLVENDLDEIGPSTATASVPGYRNEIIMVPRFGWV
jgi:hypothetical protein